VLSARALELQDDELAIARLELASRDMMDNDLRRNFERMSILLTEYGDRCREVVEQPTGRVRFWQNKLYGDEP